MTPLEGNAIMHSLIMLTVEDAIKNAEATLAAHDAELVRPFVEVLQSVKVWLTAIQDGGWEPSKGGVREALRQIETVLSAPPLYP